MTIRDYPILDDKPNESGWYIACVSIPEGGWLQPVYWSGTKWSAEDRITKVVHAYAPKFDSEKEAEDYGGQDLW